MSKKTIVNERVVQIVCEGVKKDGVRGLARKSGLSPAIITRYTQGKVGEPTEDTLKRLSEYFGVAVGWLRSDGITARHGGIDTGNAPEQKQVLCAVCGSELSFDEGFGHVDQESEWIEGDGILRVYPCDKCCKR